MEKKGRYHSMFTQGQGNVENADAKSINESHESKQNNESVTAPNTDNAVRVTEQESFVAGTSKKKNTEIKPQSSMAKLNIVLSNYKLLFFGGVILSFTSGCLTPLCGLMMGAAIDGLSSTNLEKVKREGLKFGLLCLIFIFGGSAIEYIRTFSFDYLGERLSVDFKSKIFNTFLNMHMGFYDNVENTPGNLVSQMTIKTSAINGVVLSLFSILIQALGNFISSNTIGFCYDYRLTFINILFLPFIIVVNYFFSYYASKEQEQTANATYGNVLSECLCNTLTIFSFNAQNNSKALFNAAVNQYENTYCKFSNIYGVLYGFTLCIVFFDYAATFFATGHFFVDGSITLGSLLKTYASVMTGTYFIGVAMKYVKDINLMKVSVINLFDQIEMKSELDPTRQPANAVKIRKETFKGKIEFRNVTFSYPSNKSHMILKNVSFEIKQGEKVGFIGTSGAGKSTITQLLLRFYEPNEGEILVDDVNVKDYDITSLRRAMSAVQQEPSLFTRNVLNNIRYGDLSTNEAKVLDYAKMCCIDNKLNVSVDNQSKDKKSEENNNYILSGGEKQRVAIARALIREPKILILDEATSALDNNTENEIQEMLDGIVLEKEMSVIVIAHRLNTVKKCGRCYKMENGRIVAEGTIDELKKNNQI